MWRCLVCIILLLGSVISQAAERQQFDLNPGWNLITFQTLPANGQASEVFSHLRMVVPGGHGAPLFDIESAAASHLKAAFVLHGVQVVGEDTHFTWRAFEAAQYTDPENLPPSFPFPKLDDLRQTHKTADESLSRITFGEACLILVQGILPNTTFEIQGEELATGIMTSLEAGWNLIGFPFDIAVQDQPRLNVAAFFPLGELDKIERLAGWDSASKKYQSYFPADPEQSGLQFLDSSRGYWVYVKEAIALDPRLVVGAPADADLPPLQTNPIARFGQPWNPGPEDLESSLPGVSPIFDTADTQAWIRIPKHQISLRLPLYNAGGGAIGWTARVTPFADAAPDGSVALYSADAVADVFALSSERGLVSAETQVLEITVNRTHLQPATYLADLAIKPSAGDERRFTLVVEAGGLEGQWAGFVTIDTANGHRNAVPDIDVHLHLSTDTLNGSRLLRGFIDSQETLLWPLDAPVLGQILEPRREPRWRPGYQARFVLEGGLTLAPGDLNRFPFDLFPLTPEATEVTEETDVETGLKYRTNPEGDRHYFTLPGREQRADFSNPTPLFIARHVQFLGAATTPQGDTPVISGRYVETVTGLLEGPVRLEGRFEFQRVSATPYERRPLKAFYGTPVGGVQRPAEETLEAEIKVKEDVLIQRALVVVAHTAADQMHELVLTAPDGTKITLHNRDKLGPAGSVIFDSSPMPIDALGLLDPPEIRGAAPLPAASGDTFDRLRYEARLRDTLAGYVVRRPRESLDKLRNRRGAGPWTLSWTHFDTKRTRAFKGWSLLLFGPRIVRVRGQVEVAGEPQPEPYADVRLDVVGLPASLGKALIEFDRTNGEFEIAYLPGMRVDILASKPGFAQAGISGLDSPGHPRGFRDRLEGFLAGGPGSDDLTLTLQPGDGPPAVRSSLDHAVAPAVGQTVIVKDVRLSVFGKTPAGAPLHWEVSWQGNSALAPGSEAPKGRSVTVDLEFPADAFKPENQYTQTVSSRVLIDAAGTGTYVTLPHPLTVTLADAPRSRYRLLQGAPLLGFGGQMVYAGGIDATGELGLQAQKTTVAKVDLDHVPRSRFGREDVDLHPREFDVREPDESGYRYALIVETADGRFGRLEPPLPGQTSRYRDQDISGRDINAPGEPVAIHSAIGGRIVNLGVSGTDGEYRISVGTTPGLDP